MRRTIDSIVVDVARVSGVARKEILSPCLLRRVTTARMAVYALAVAAGHTTTVIGRVLDRDHSTVVYGARQAKVRGDVRALVERLAA